MSTPNTLYEELHTALLGAFSRDELSRLVRVRLGEEFEALTPDKDLRTQVASLLRWAERPRNPELQAIQIVDRIRRLLPRRQWLKPEPTHENLSLYGSFAKVFLVFHN